MDPIRCRPAVGRDWCGHLFGVDRGHRGLFHVGTAPNFSLRTTGDVGTSWGDGDEGRGHQLQRGVPRNRR